MRTNPPRRRPFWIALLTMLGLVAGVTFGASPVSAATSAPPTLYDTSIFVSMDAPVAKAVSAVESPGVVAAVAAPSVAAAVPEACGVPYATTVKNWGCGRMYLNPYQANTPVFQVDDRLSDGTCVYLDVQKWSTGGSTWHNINSSCGPMNQIIGGGVGYSDIKAGRIRTGTGLTAPLYKG